MSVMAKFERQRTRRVRNRLILARMLPANECVLKLSKSILKDSILRGEKQLGISSRVSLPTSGRRVSSRMFEQSTIEERNSLTTSLKSVMFRVVKFANPLSRFPIGGWISATGSGALVESKQTRRCTDDESCCIKSRVVNDKAERQCCEVGNKWEMSFEDRARYWPSFFGIGNIASCQLWANVYNPSQS